MPSYVVTGANRGIGFEFIKQLSKDSNNIVVGLVRNKANSKELLDLSNSLKNVHVFQADITDVSALKIAAQEVSKVTGGTLDNLINNAAFVPEENFLQTPFGYYEGKEDVLEKDLIDTYKINVLGPMYTINAFLPLIRAAAAKSTAKVITLSSGAGDPDFTLEGKFARSTPYSASKAALNMVNVKYASEFLNEDIIFLAISPGIVNTATKPPTPEERQLLVEVIGDFKRAAPWWDGNPISPETSIKAMFEVFSKLTKKDSGSFISHKGNKQWV